MNYLKKLFEQSSYYFIGNILIALAGFISFPIWTRYFSKEDYGILSIINITISFLVVFSKLGLPHAALRYYSEFQEQKRGVDVTSYYTTMLLGAFFISSFIVFSILFAAKLFFHNSINTVMHDLLPLTAAVVLIVSINSVLTEFIRAEQRGRFYSIIQLAQRYGQIFISVIIVFLFLGNLYGFFLGMAVAGGCILVILLSILIYQKKIYIKKFSLSFLKESIQYGFPLIWFELSNMLLSMGDRYLIQYYMGPRAVGVYSAGYNLSDMAQSVLSMPLRLAVLPMYLSIWNRDGEENTRGFLSDTLNYYFLIGIPLILGMSWYGKEIITVLASSKFQDAHVIIPYIVFPLIIHGAFIIYGAGLYIQKRTTILMYLTILAAVINLLLNAALIPKFGISGAAYATFISYLILATLITLKSYKYLKVRIQFLPLVKYAFLSAVVTYAMSGYSADNISRLIFKIGSVVLLYVVAVLMIDGSLRQKVISFMKRK